MALHIFINIFDYKIPTYGLLIAVGVISANIIALLYVMKDYRQDNPEDFLILEAYVFLGAFFGAKALYVVVSYKKILWSEMLIPTYFNKIMQGGFVFYGGLAGGIIFCFVAGKLHHILARDYLQHYIFLIPFVHCFGRVGCFIVGCCYGIPYSGYGSVVYQEGSLAPAGIPLLPIQLIEAAFLLALSVGILFIQRHGHEQDTVEIYFISYGMIRFILEFFRFDEERGNIGVLSVSQFISLFFIIIAAVILKRRNYENACIILESEENEK